jgi:hypothetical protein
MTNSSHGYCVSQHRQIHMCNILFNLIIMLNVLVIIDIATFDISHDGQIWSLLTTSEF